MTYDLDRLRLTEFAWAARGDAIYLDHASTGPLPARTARVAGEWTQRRREPFRLRDAELFETARIARQRCARLVGAPAACIALQVNTSYGINLAARALPLAAGDVVVTFDGEFPANVYPWMALEAARGVSLRLIPARGGLPDEDALVASLDDERVRVVTVSWVGFANGHRVDLARIGRECRARGKYFVVDAIQGLGAATLDAPALGIDILACGGQKWLLSPWGTGFVYVREALVRELTPAAVGWMAMQGGDDFSRLVDYDPAWRDDARRFEVVTIPYHDFAAMNESLALLEELGAEAVTAHIAGLCDRIVTWVQARDDMRLATSASPAKRLGIVSVAPSDPSAAAARLAAAGVACSLRERAVRLSPHCYTTVEEIERVLAALAKG